MQRFLLAHETVVPLLLLAVVAAVLLAAPVGRRVGLGRTGALLLLLAVLGPLVLTLGPQLPLDLDAGRQCADRVRPYRWWGQGGEEVANALLLLPLGLLPPLLLRPRRAVVVLGVAAGLPLAFELTQYALPVLGRECDLTDVLLNGSGLVVGAVLGVLGALLRRVMVDGVTAARVRRPRT